jgi:hypothetical protein
MPDSTTRNGVQVERRPARLWESSKKRSMTPPTRPQMMAPRFAHQDESRALVMQVLQDAVDDGHAVWRAGTDDGMELHLFSGEVFLLTDAGITRLR